MNRLDRAHDQDVIQNIEMTQDLFSEHLLTNEASIDALWRYNDSWTEGFEMATQRNVPANSASKGNTTHILPVK